MTDREVQVLAYQATVLSTADICQEIDISPGTLRRHTMSIRSKLVTGHEPGFAADGDARLDDLGWPFS